MYELCFQVQHKHLQNVVTVTVLPRITVAEFQMSSFPLKKSALNNKL